MERLSRMGSLQGRRFLLTGATGGIGTELARGIVADGARVALVARDESRLAHLASELGDAAVAVPADVTDADAIMRAAAAASDRLGGLDGVIANAGRSLMSNLFDGDLSAWRECIELNLFAPLATVRACLPHFPQTGVRDVVVMGSTAGHVPLPELTVYGAAKQGLEAAHEHMRIALTQRSIRCLLVVPGSVASGMTVRVDEGVGRPLDRMGRYEPLAPAVVADAVRYALSAPAAVAIETIVLRSLGQTAP